MKNSKLVNVILSVIVAIAIVFVANSAFAATDLTDSVLNNTTNVNNTTNNVVNNIVNNTAKNAAVLTTNNTSTYNNTALPKTGATDTMPAIILVVVLGISGVYAYKKMQEYKNI